MAKKKNSKKKGTEKAKNQVTRPHDTAFKDLFGRKEVAKDFIQNNLPEEVLEAIDLDSMERKDGTFVGKSLEESFSDLIYGVRINDREAYISLLLEHKSYPDNMAIFQVTRYVLDAWTKLAKDKEENLPVVIPIIVYHGKRKWNYKKDLRDMIPGYYELPEYLKKRIPVMKHDLADIYRYEDEEFDVYRPLTKLVLKSFKYVSQEDEDMLIEVFLLALEEACDSEPEEVVFSYTEVVLMYFSVVKKNVTEEKILKKIEELGGKGAKLMTILEERELKGRQEGMEKGRQEGMEKGIEKGMQAGELKRAKETARELLRMGLEPDQIAQATKLSLEEVNQVKKEMMN